MATESTLSAEERVAQMDEILEDEQIVREDIETELKRLRDLQFRKTQDLHQARTQERNTEAEIQGSRAATRNLTSKIYKLDHDSLKQQEIVYNQVSEGSLRESSFIMHIQQSKQMLIVFGIPCWAEVCVCSSV